MVKHRPSGPPEDEVGSLHAMDFIGFSDSCLGVFILMFSSVSLHNDLWGPDELQFIKTDGDGPDETKHVRRPCLQSISHFS